VPNKGYNALWSTSVQTNEFSQWVLAGWKSVVPSGAHRARLNQDIGCRLLVQFNDVQCLTCFHVRVWGQNF
jgi:hypothetical protein